MEKKHLLEKMMHAVDLDSEPIPGKTLIEVVGNHSVLVENHCGVMCYCNHNIMIRSRSGYISVCGDGLLLSKMSKDLLRITGEIKSIELRGRGESGQ